MCVRALSSRPTCALVLLSLAVVPPLTHAVVLARARAAHAAGHGVAAVPAPLAQQAAAGALLLDEVARREVLGGREVGVVTIGFLPRSRQLDRYRSMSKLTVNYFRFHLTFRAFCFC